MSISAKRIEKYLAERKKRRQLDQAWIHWINEAELRTEDVAALLKQRAELLEALKRAEKKIVGAYDGITHGYGEEFAKNDGDVIIIRDAITKAEATK